MGTGVQSFIHLEDFGAPDPTFFVEAEHVHFARFCRAFPAEATVHRCLGTKGQWAGIFCEPDIGKLHDLVSKADEMKAARRSRFVIESVQAANKGVIDGGRTQRDLAGREYVNQARFSYATQLLQLPARQTS